MKKAFTPDWHRQICGLFLIGAIIGSTSNLAGAAATFKINPQLASAKSLASL